MDGKSKKNETNQKIKITLKINNMENQKNNEEQIMQRSVAAALRISFVAFLFLMSFWVLKPFVAPVVWGIIIAVGIYPMHTKLAKLLGGKEKLSAVILSLSGILILLIPIIMFASSTVEGIQTAAEKISDGTFKIERPREDIKDWPMVGESIYNAWSLASNSISKFYDTFESQIRSYLPKVAGAVSGLFGGVLMFVISLIIAGAFLVIAKDGKVAAEKVYKVLVGEKGAELVELSAGTIKSVVQGVIGIAIIQAFFIAIGLYFIDMPGAGIIALIVLIFAIIQLPPILPMLPVIFYVFSYADTTPAIIFTVWAIFWSAADTFLKPMFLGKGVDVPMLVVLLGAIGGMVALGPVGLFIGSVVLSLGYTIFNAMLEDVD